ncbi:MAG: hypothetical protein H6779_00075 [Candidatus Nomurabacteria bacterium]|nr:MAG: hypothetical protein H6779_00075 [Candidatus Nomurabacteria bacterium]
MTNFFRKNGIYVAGVLVGIFVVLVSAQAITNQKLSSLRYHIDNEITLQTAKVENLAKLIGNGKSNAKAEALVKACASADNDLYENLLSKLDNGLGQSDLKTLNSLFDECGYVYANRRADMVYQFEYEVNNLLFLVQERNYFDGEKVGLLDNSLKWNELLLIEDNIRDNFLELVVIQKHIITTLLAGETKDSYAVQALREDAEEVRTNLSESTKKASTLRSELIKS